MHNYATLCHAVSCCVILRHAICVANAMSYCILSHCREIMPCHIVSCHTVSSHTGGRPCRKEIMPCHVVSCHTVGRSCHLTLYHVTPEGDHTMSHCIMPHRIIPHRREIMPCHIEPCRTVGRPCHVTLHHVTL